MQRIELTSERPRLSCRYQSTANGIVEHVLSLVLVVIAGSQLNVPASWLPLNWNLKPLVCNAFPIPGLGEQIVGLVG